MKELNVLIPEQREQYDRLSQSVNNIDKKVDLQKKESLIDKFKELGKSVVAYGAAMFSVDSIIQFFTNTLFNMTKELDSLEFSMKTVIKSSSELDKTQKFLSNTAKNYGHDLLTLSERYIKFRAASIQSNMSAQETMNIFNSVAKAAGVLGLKTDEVNGVFLALEQMISKGKVTTEELRRQDRKE